MTTPRAPHAGTAAGARRKPPRRSMPRWLLNASAVDPLARSRCLLVLSVLSGAVPVATAAMEAKLSRASYYTLEMRALGGMLRALDPRRSSAQDAPQGAWRARIEALEAKALRLEQEKRRLERLLMLTRKTLGTSVIPLRRGRPPKDPDSILRPKWRSPSSTAKAALDALSRSTPGGEAGS